MSGIFQFLAVHGGMGCPGARDIDTANESSPLHLALRWGIFAGYLKLVLFWYFR
jgi:hypothetical protein